MIEELEQFGLDHYESKAVQALLNDKLSVKSLSKKAQIPFGKVYSVIKSLKRKNIICETNTRPKLVFIENVSGIISRLIKEKDEKDSILRQKLKSLASEMDRGRSQKTPFFQIGTTLEENKEIQLRTFIEAEHEVLQIMNVHHNPNINRESKIIWEKEIEKAVERGIKFKVIYPENIKLPMIIDKLARTKPARFQIKKHDANFTRCDIIDRKKVLLKLVSDDPLQFGGILFIEDEKLAANLFKIFMHIWNQ